MRLVRRGAGAILILVAVGRMAAAAVMAAAAGILFGRLLALLLRGVEMTREEREAAREHVAAGRVCYRCGGPTAKPADELPYRRLCAFCQAREAAPASPAGGCPPGEHGACAYCGERPNGRLW